jgi:hypothetical protein
MKYSLNGPSLSGRHINLYLQYRRHRAGYGVWTCSALSSIPGVLLRGAVWAVSSAQESAGWMGYKWGCISSLRIPEKWGGCCGGYSPNLFCSLSERKGGGLTSAHSIPHYPATSQVKRLSLTDLLDSSGRCNSLAHWAGRSRNLALRQPALG